MDAQDKVLERFPKAEAREEPAIFEHDTHSLIGGGYWAVFAGWPGFDCDELGQGRSVETEAWSDAARRASDLAACLTGAAIPESSPMRSSDSNRIE